MPGDQLAKAARRLYREHFPDDHVNDCPDARVVPKKMTVSELIDQEPMARISMRIECDSHDQSRTVSLYAFMERDSDE